MPSTLDWLRTRDDGALVALLRARPDLTVPAPGDLTVLAGRLNTGPSVWRAMESLNQFQIQILQAIAVLGGDKHAVDRAQLQLFLGEQVSPPALTTAVDTLQSLALVRGDDRLQMPSAVLAVLGPYPAGLGAPGTLPVQDAAAALAGLDGTSRGIVDRLAHGIPRGTTGPGSSVARAVTSLVAARLLRRVDADTVELPREVGLALRGSQPLGPILVEPPAATVVEHAVATVDGTAGGQALAAVDRVRRLVEAIGQNPPPALRSGGLGIRDLRRLAKSMGTDERVTAMDLEVLAGAGLIAAADLRGRAAPSWTPTSDVDDFLDLADEVAWGRIVEVWLDLRRSPSRVGSKDANDKVQNALSPEMSWMRGPVDRRFVLQALAVLPPGAGLEVAALSAHLAWRSPLRPADQLQAVMAGTIAEATALGIIAFTALSTAGRALLEGSVPSAVAALRAALPAPVDTLMVQADLTVVAPGRLVPELAGRLDQTADVESAGSATVYRISASSIRRALDAGVSTTELHELFRTHSVTGVPQALSYLIDDVGRRYGVLRLGTSSTYLRSDDPGLIDQAIAQAESLGLPVRRLAPTVAISSVALQELMTHLRAGGLVPAAENAAGALVDLRPRPRRAKPTAAAQHWREPPSPTVEQLEVLVTRMRSADRAGHTGGAAAGTSEIVTALRDAANHRGSLWIGYVDAEGATSQRMIEPVAISAGTVVAYDRLRGAVRTFALHRISWVRPVPTADEDGVGGVPEPPQAIGVREGTEDVRDGAEDVRDGAEDVRDPAEERSQT